MKTYVVEIDSKIVRTIKSEKIIKVGNIIPDEMWLGKKMIGGVVTKIF